MQIKLIQTFKSVNSKVKANFISFIKEERSARGTTEEAYLTYGAIVIGVIVLLIATGFMDNAFNAIGNFFSDGVNGDIDENGLNKWGDQTNGFNKK